MQGPALISLIVTTFLMHQNACAFNFEFETLRGNFDTSISAGLAWRVESRDATLIGIGNGGVRQSLNTDDGDLNYGSGAFSTALKVTHDLGATYKNLSSFVRAFYFYDLENENSSRDHTPLSQDALDLVGSDARILDAYVTATIELQGRTLVVRVGKQVINWGESTFIPNGINATNPVDISRLHTPGAELREALVPLSAVWGSWAVTDTFTLEGYYQLDWEKVVLDPVGSYFSVSDIFDKGGRSLYLADDLESDTIPPGSGLGAPIGVVIPRSADHNPKNHGQFGLAIKWYLSKLGQSEVGIYYLRYHSRLPILSLKSGSRKALLDGDYAASAGYYGEFPENIDLFGLSFNTDIGRSGVALQGEVSYRHGIPLQIDLAELTFSLLSPVLPVYGQVSQVGHAEFDRNISGYRRFDMTQVQVTGSRFFSQILGASRCTLVAEIGGTWVHQMPDENVLRLAGQGTTTSGNLLATELGMQKTTQEDGFGTAYSMGYRLSARFDYNGIIGAINLTPKLEFSHDLQGITPLPVANFIEGRKAVAIGVEANYLNRWSTELSFTRYSGAREFNLIHDRDFISFNIKLSI